MPVTVFDQNLIDGFADAALLMGMRLTHGSDEVFVLPSEVSQTEQLIGGGFDPDAVLSVTGIASHFTTLPVLGDLVTLGGTSYRVLRTTPGINHGLITLALGSASSK
jgi:hypothetical protein